MKKSGPTKNLPNKQERGGIPGIIRAYVSVIRILHKNLGAPRIIAAYIFFLFAVLSLSFTIRIPMSSHFPIPDEWARAQSRLITGFIMVINLLVYGIIMNWGKGGVFYVVIRIALISAALYLNVFLVQIVVVLIRDGTFF